MKSNIININIIAILFLFVTYQTSAQIETNLPIVTYPHPSANALLQATINPVNYNTGVPDISVNLFNLSTISKSINVNTRLSYNTSGLSLNSKVSDTGMGWSLTGVPSISKLVRNDPDFRSRPDMVTTSEDDIYVYNFNGHSGKFQIAKNQAGIYEIKYGGPTNLVIDFVMNSNGSSTNQVNKFDEVDYFIIYDENGNKYIFDIYDLKASVFLLMPKYLFFEGWIPSGDTPPNGYEAYQKTAAIYRSTYYASTVKDQNNQTIVNYTYDSYLKSVNVNSATALQEKEHKIKEIKNTNNDKIVFDYYYSPSNSIKFIDNPNSDFNLNSVKLINNKNQQLKKIEFIYDLFNIHYDYYSQVYYDHNPRTVLSRRILKEVREFNVDLDDFISTKFEYNGNQLEQAQLASCHELNYGRDSFGYLNLKHSQFPVIENAFPNDIASEYSTWYTEPSVVTIGALSKIIHPTGGCTLYEFESNTYKTSYYENLYGNDYYTNFNISEINHFNNELNQTTYNFNTSNSNTYNFSVNGSNSKNLYFKFYSQPFYSNIHHDPNEALEPTYRIIGPNGPLYEIRPGGFIHDLSSTFNQHIGDSYLFTYHPCIGNRFELEPGNYSIQVISYYHDTSANGMFIITEKIPSNTIQKYFYGGGLRIKKIATFSDSNIINDPDQNNDKLVDYVSFQYNEFEDSSKSSYDFTEFYTPISNPINEVILNHEASINYTPYYSNVKVIRGKNTPIGYEKFHYYRFSELPNIHPRHKNVLRFTFRLQSNELLKKHELFDSSSKIVLDNEINHSYLIDNRGFGWLYKNLEQTNNYFYQNNNSAPKIINTSKGFTYNPLNKKISESTVTNSQNETLTTKYFYHSGNSIHSQNRIAEIERIETFRGSELLSKSKINYNNNWANNVSYLPQTIQTAKAGEAYENRLHYLQYDAFGHPLEVKQEDGMHICYIWGYNQTQPIAKIENATYAQVQPHVANLQTLSNGNNEQNLISALNNLRTLLPNAMITTYTYKPLIGISTVTDPKGDKQTYHYDTFNRLEFVKDKDGNILSENKYHYRTQN